MNYLIQYIYFWSLTTFKPVLEFLSKIYPKFSSKEHIFSRYYEIEDSLAEGDLILTQSDAHLTNLINFGEWKHALIYQGRDFSTNQPMVVEAIGKGVVRRTLVEMLSSKDRICILRPTEKLLAELVQWQRYFQFISEQVGKPYDHTFDSFSKNSHESFYCSELFYSAIKYANPDADFDLRSKFGIKTVTPMDLYNMSSKGKLEHILTIKRK